MSAELPSLPNYEKPKERLPASIPETIGNTVKMPSSLNKVIGKMMSKLPSKMVVKPPKAKTLSRRVSRVRQTTKTIRRKTNKFY